MLSCYAVSMEQLTKVSNNLGFQMGSAVKLASNHTLSSLADLSDHMGVLTSVGYPSALEVFDGNVHFEN